MAWRQTGSLHIPTIWLEHCPQCDMDDLIRWQISCWPLMIRISMVLLVVYWNMVWVWNVTFSLSLVDTVMDGIELMILLRVNQYMTWLIHCCGKVVEVLIWICITWWKPILCDILIHSTSGCLDKVWLFVLICICITWHVGTFSSPIVLCDIIVTWHVGTFSSPIVLCDIEIFQSVFLEYPNAIKHALTHLSLLWLVA